MEDVRLMGKKNNLNAGPLRYRRMFAVDGKKEKSKCWTPKGKEDVLGARLLLD